MTSSRVETSAAFVDGGTYRGLIDTNTRAADGKGKRTFADGSEYEGDWKQGVMEGIGTMKFGMSCPSLDLYTGEWRRNKFHGTGRLLYQYFHAPNVPAEYSGEFKFGKMDGKGRRTAPRGESYEGNWKEDKRHGPGIQKWSNGHCYEGTWRDDKRHGNGKHTGAKGELSYDGDWQDDKYQGQGSWMPFEDAKDFGDLIFGVGQNQGTRGSEPDSKPSDSALILFKKGINNIESGLQKSKYKRSGTDRAYAADTPPEPADTTHQHEECEDKMNTMCDVIQSLTSELSTLRETIETRDQQMAQLTHLHTIHKERLQAEAKVRSMASPEIADLNKSFRRDIVELLVSLDHIDISAEAPLDVHQYQLPEYLNRTQYGESVHHWQQYSNMGYPQPPYLPSRLAEEDSSHLLEVTKGGLEINYIGDLNSPVGSIRADYPIPSSCGRYYFEIMILCKGDDGYIGVGFGSRSISLDKQPGWANGSWGYHGDDGNSFNCGIPSEYGPTFTTGDIIGCGINFEQHQIAYTKNGELLGIVHAYLGRIGDIYPFIGLHSIGESVHVNFGQEVFSFDITNQQLAF